MEPKVILAALVIVIVLGTILYYTVFKKSDESEPEEEPEEPEEVEEGGSSSDPGAEIFSIDSEIRMYEQCNSNSKIISEMAIDVGSLTSSELPSEGFLNTSENEKVRRIEVKNVEILPGSKWTVVSNNNQGVKGETTVILDYAQGYMGKRSQVLDVGYVEKDEYGVGKCSDNAESYIKDINIFFRPMKTRVKDEDVGVEGYILKK